jgi:hypothetical protein
MIHSQTISIFLGGVALIRSGVVDFAVVFGRIHLIE